MQNTGTRSKKIDTVSSGGKGAPHTHSNQLETHTKKSSAAPAASQPVGTKAAWSVHQGKQGAASAELPAACDMFTILTWVVTESAPVHLADMFTISLV